MVSREILEMLVFIVILTICNISKFFGQFQCTLQNLMIGVLSVLILDCYSVAVHKSIFEYRNLFGKFDELMMSDHVSHIQT